MKVIDPQQNEKPQYKPKNNSSTNENKQQESQSKLNANGHSSNDGGGGMLAPNRSAPINIELVSFGFKYSVPPHARKGWSHSNPICHQLIVERCHNVLIM